MPQPNHHTIASDRPKLKEDSVAFETVMGVGYGAVLGSVFAFTMNAINKMRKLESRTSIITEIISWGAVFGVVGMCESLAKNRERAKHKPYIEKLEAELAAKNAEPKNTAEIMR